MNHNPSVFRCQSRAQRQHSVGLKMCFAFIFLSILHWLGLAWLRGADGAVTGQVGRVMRVSES
jgi:hypothetical protein